MFRIALRVVALALVVLPGSQALAQARTAVLGVEAVDASNEAAARLADALRAQVRQSSAFRLTAGKSLEEIKLVFGCIDEKPDCMARAGRSMNVGKLIWGTLRKGAGGLHLSIKLLDVGGARIERSVSETVTAADVAGSAARRTVERVTGGFIPNATGTVRINCNLAGASVSVGARDLGVNECPVTVENLAPGRHLVKVSKEGYRAWRQDVTVAAGEITVVEAALEAEKVDVPPATQPVPGGGDSNTGWKVAFWISAAATVGFGGAILGTGLQVLSAQDKKNEAIGAYRRNGGSGSVFTTGDVCQEISGAPRPTGTEGAVNSLQSACDSGLMMRDMTNVFIGLTAGAAVISGVFYYKAYISKPERRSRKEEATRSRESDLQWMVAPSIGLQGGGLDLHLRF